MKIDWESKTGGVIVMAASFLTSLGLASWSGVTPNIGTGIWTAVASVVFFAGGLGVALAVMKAEK
jgi:hypothetical protein